MPDAGVQSEIRIDYREIPKQSCKTANPHRTAFQCSHISKLGWVPQYRQCKAHTESSRIRRTVAEDNNDSKLTPFFFNPLSLMGLPACVAFAATRYFSGMSDRALDSLFHLGDAHAHIDDARNGNRIDASPDSTALYRIRRNSRARIPASVR
ncbi:hypothetical protein [Ralstonia pseudosolanacearum]|uniref:Uncharacterized protein n=1 Tax=Ralstonia solanacearum TaxID=305 RepID=A0AA92IFR2_RALSL|nr:hypothetical protein [Ralstonia pseudosolanacearum]QCX51270.1 hypothetical protein E7Z57_19455 [Ralstonia pseudosolanacearum]